MYAFAREFADLTRRMDGARNDAATAMKILAELSEKRDNLLIKNRDDIEIGIYAVYEGCVTVQSVCAGLEITWHDSFDAGHRSFQES